MAWLCATIWVNFKEIPAIMMCTPMHIYPTTQIGVLFDFEGGGGPKFYVKIHISSLLSNAM